MLFDQVRQQVEQRVTDYRRSRDAHTVLGDEAVDDAAALWQAAQPTTAGRPTAEENQRLADACGTLGWLHFLRYNALPEAPEHLTELALTIIYLAPLAQDNPHVIPGPLQGVLGAAAEADLQGDLAYTLLEQARNTPDPALPDAAARLLTALLAAIPHDHPDRPMHLSNLGNAYRGRFERGGKLADIDKAIEAGGQAVAAAPDDHPNRPMYLSNLGNAYMKRFERGGMVADLDHAIEIVKRAVAATPHDDPDRPRWLSSLGTAYAWRFERGGVVADLDQAVEAFELSVAATRHDDPNRPRWLSSLGTVYMKRFERGGVVADLDHAIEIVTRSVAATPHDHPDRPRWLANLGGAYMMRFDRGGALADLDRAINSCEQAVAATPHDHPNRHSYLSNLGGAYRFRFERSGLVADIDHAIQTMEQSVAATPHDHPDRPKWLANLGGVRMKRFDRAGVVADLDQAIEAFEQSVTSAPQDHPHQPLYLANLGGAYQRRFDRGAAPADLAKAIMIKERAVAATPQDHPNRARYLANLGRAYQARLDADGQGIDRETLLALAGQVTAAQTASPPWRVQAGSVVGSLAHAAGEHGVAVELLDAAVRMLPSVAPREAGWADQEHRLGEHRGLVGEAVAAHCAINDPVGAVETAELGRGILLAAQLDSRSDLTDLEHAQPDLAVEFRRVRDQLNTGWEPAQPDFEPVAQIEHRKRLWTEHDQLLARIRRQPGFARFLLPPRLADLRAATAGGAAILVNTGQRRSDAIIITSDAAPVHVPLPDASYADIQSRAHALLEVTHDDSLVSILRRQRVVPEILGWLWDKIVEPVLGALPPVTGATSALPRVWWLPTGLLGLFPLHAAGHPGEFGALDAVISSYTPTLRTLAHSGTRPPATIRRQLTVALGRTPGQPDLPGTVAEATTLHTHQPDALLLRDEAATTGRVLAALPEATWAHFACHAGANLTAPSEGGLALHDATLALPEISQLRLGNAELAYLSACSTAHRGLQLADESLHLASAFQLAGFRHVIASLWRLNDHVAAITAAAFYQHLPTTPTADDAAAALHQVTRELRAMEEYSDRPDLWAALIHNGP